MYGLKRTVCVWVWVAVLVAGAFLGTRSAAQPGPSPVSAQDGLVSWWSGDGNALDPVSGNHGTLKAGTTYTPAVFGSGFSFDGIDDRVEVPDVDSLKLTNSLSISAWIYPRSVPGPTATAELFFRGDNRNELDPYSLSLHNGNLIFHVESLSANTFIAVPIAAGRFYHVAATLDDVTGLMRLYLNGTVVTEQFTAIRPFRDLEPFFHPGIGIGNHPDYPNTPHVQPFFGTIDEVKVYNRARTAAEIQDEYEAGISQSLLVTGFEADRVARFEAGTGTFVDTVAGGGLDHPSGLAFGPDGNLYVGSLGNDRVLRYRGTTGQYLDTFVAPGSGGLDGPEGLVFGPDGNLYVASRYTNQVLCYHGQTGAFLGVFASGGGLSVPFDLTFGADCNLYVSSRGTASILAYDGHTGSFLGAFVASGAGGLQIDEPRGLTFGPDNQLYTAAPHTNRVLRFDGSNGGYLDEFVAPAAGGLNEPAGLRFGPDGHLYVSSSTTNDVKRFDGSTGQFRDVFAVGGGLAHATFLTFSPAAVSNRAPIAKAGEDVQRAWQGVPVQVQLDGSRSCDLDADPLSYEWREGGTLLGTTATITGSFDFGVHLVTLTVRDPAGAVGQDQVVVSIVSTAAPSNLKGAAVSGTEVRLSWRDNSGVEDGFLIERRISGGTFTQVGTRDPAAGVGSVVQYTDVSGLVPDTGYVYRVRATGLAGASGYSNEAMVTTTPTPPSAPTNLTLAVTAPTKMQLTWTDTSLNETGFSVERKTGAGGFTFIGVAAADATGFPDPGLTADTVYTYRVRALGNGGNSAFTGDATLPTPPLAPTTLVVSVPAAGQLRLTWTDTSQTESGFRIERRVADLFTQVGTVDAGVTQFVDQAVAAGASYTYQVRSINAGGASSPSSTASGLVLPATPTQLTATPFSATHMDLNWVDGNPSPASVKVERSQGGGGFTQVAITPAGTITYRDSGLTASTTYTYRIRATNLSGDSDFSANATGQTYPPPPASPSGLVLNPLTARSVQLTWQDNSTTETGFEVMRAGPGIGPFELVSTTAANATGYLDTSGLMGSSTYSYRVRAVNAGGGSSFTAPQSVTTPLDLPATPTGPAATALSGSQIRITWVDASDNETGFRVERKPAGGEFALAGTAPAGATEFVDGALAESSVYAYRIYAENAQGSSSPSATVSATTRPNTPSNLVATAGNRKVDLTWIDQSAHESGFRIERKSGGESFSQLALVGAGVTTYADSAVSAGVAYTYRVSAMSADGASAPSNESSATPRNEAPLAKLVITPRSVSFGTVRLGRTGTKAVKLTNKGKETVTGTVGSVTAPFSLTAGGGAFSLAPKQSRTVSLTFAPSAAGVASAKLRITSTDPKAAAVEVTLTGKGR